MMTEDQFEKLKEKYSREEWNKIMKAGDSIIKLLSNISPKAKLIVKYEEVHEALKKICDEIINNVKDEKYDEIAKKFIPILEQITLLANDFEEEYLKK